MSAPTDDPCGYCGTTERPRSIHSGVAECQRCWDWRKLDGPAASHWAKVSEIFLSNVDYYDLMNFMPMVFGDKETGPNMLHAARELYYTSKGLIMMHGLRLEEQGPRPE